MIARPSLLFWLVVGLICSACGGTPEAPTAPSRSSFLAGTWRGTLTVEVNPGDPSALPPSDGSTVWMFEVVPGTNLQTFRATIQSDHAWLLIATVATTALVPTNTPPAQISTQGDYSSPRGCRGTFGSFGIAEATRIEGDFTGVDCANATFSGRVVLTKD